MLLLLAFIPIMDATNELPDTEENNTIPIIEPSTTCIETCRLHNMNYYDETIYELETRCYCKDELGGIERYVI